MVGFHGGQRETEKRERVIKKEDREVHLGEIKKKRAREIDFVECWLVMYVGCGSTLDVRASMIRMQCLRGLFAIDAEAPAK